MRELPEVLNEKEAAEYCRLSVNSFRKAVRLGKLPKPPALAAMEALLEPSEEMVRAATDYIATNIDGGCSAHDAREVLRTALTRAMGK